MQTEQLYRIRPLVWKRRNGLLVSNSTVADYIIKPFDDAFHLYTHDIFHIGEHDTEASAKAAAEAHWRERVAECLEAVEL